MNEALLLAKTLWDYNVLHQNIEKADVIVALGNSDIRTAQKAATLFNNHFGDRLVTTGGFGRLTKDAFTIPEARLFADEAIGLGVPTDKILIEDASTNTFDNIRFTKKLLAANGLKPKSIIIVTKPYMERRALGITLATWPGVVVAVTSPSLDFENYCNDQIPEDLLINMLVGDTQRVMIFSDSGDIPKQSFPTQVIDAYHRLISLGYDKQIVMSENIPHLLDAVTSGNNI